MSRTFKITLAYDGTAYRGWQRQAGGASIQGLIEETLARIEGAPVTVHGAGRTDAGVHALGQVASVQLATALDTRTLRRALNATLPADVRAVAVEEAPEGFHARFSATGKIYEYWIFDGEVQPPFARAWSWHRPYGLDVAAMDSAAGALVGTRDFAAFQSTGTDVATSVRTMTCARVRIEPVCAGPMGVPGRAPGGDAGTTPPAGVPPAGMPPADAAPGPASAAGRFVVIRLEADGFLRHMVRAVTGTLVDVGEGRREAGSLPALIASRDRASAGATAPAHGLVLVRVEYGG